MDDDSASNAGYVLDRPWQTISVPLIPAVTSVPMPRADPPGPNNVVVGQRLRDEKKTRALFETYTRRARREVLTTLPLCEGAADILHADREMHLTPVRNGVRASLLCDISVLAVPSIYTELQARVDAGVRVRLSRSMVNWLTVFDDELAVVNTAGETATDFLFIRERVVVAAFRQSFSSLWRMAVEIPSGRLPSTENRDRAVLGLLRAG